MNIVWSLLHIKLFIYLCIFYTFFIHFFPFYTMIPPERGRIEIHLLLYILQEGLKFSNR